MVTGLGWATCLGTDRSSVSNRLRRMEHGIRPFPPFEDPKIPIALAAPVEGFNTDSADQEDWTYPASLKLRLEQLRGLAPHGIYAAYAVQQAIEEAKLDADQVSNPRTGLFAASAGSTMMVHHHMTRMDRFGPMRCSPLGIVASIAGTLNFNLCALHRIRGASTGFVSACASSGHALGYAFEEIALGRQDRMIVVGAEDCNRETIAPFAGMRVLSRQTDPDLASRPFDQGRDGFVGTGGAVAMVLESREAAAARGAPELAEIHGWGQATDGFHVAAPHPDGDGLRRAMEMALARAEVTPGQIDYVNAHATSTPVGDAAECKALKAIFGTAHGPSISSTKALTGHGLSLSSIMETAFCVLALNEGFMPGSAHISQLDAEAEGLDIIRQTKDAQPNLVLTNSSGFGGANVCLVLGRGKTNHAALLS